MTIIFFDIDGVIVKECGVAEFGYAFVLNLLSDPKFDIQERIKDLQVEKQYLQIAQEIRYIVKGKNPVEKIEILKRHLKSSCSISNKDVVAYWYQAQRAYISKYYPVETYKIKQIDNVFKEITTLKETQKILISSLTANEQTQAHWLLQYAGVLQYFDAVVGYDLDKTQNITSKVELLRQELNGKEYKTKIMIGDGIPDMEAGKANGCICIGIGHKLKEHGADYVFAEGDEYDLMSKKIKELIQ